MIKSLKYQINSIVSNKSCHIELIQGSGLEIEVLEQTQIYVKVNCKKQSAPAKFSLDYVKTVKEDLKIWASFTNPMPSNFDHSYKFNKVPKFQIWPRG